MFYLNPFSYFCMAFYIICYFSAVIFCHFQVGPLLFECGVAVVAPIGQIKVQTISSCSYTTGHKYLRYDNGPKSIKEG